MPPRIFASYDQLDIAALPDANTTVKGFDGTGGGGNIQFLVYQTTAGTSIPEIGSNSSAIVYPYTFIIVQLVFGDVIAQKVKLQK